MQNKNPYTHPTMPALYLQDPVREAGINPACFVTPAKQTSLISVFVLHWIAYPCCHCDPKIVIGKEQWIRSTVGIHQRKTTALRHANTVLSPLHRSVSARICRMQNADYQFCTAMACCFRAPFQVHQVMSDDGSGQCFCLGYRSGNGGVCLWTQEK